MCRFGDYAGRRHWLLVRRLQQLHAHTALHNGYTDSFCIPVTVISPTITLTSANDAQTQSVGAAITPITIHYRSCHRRNRYWPARRPVRFMDVEHLYHKRRAHP
ncbi:MAG: hypothetical protein LBD91_02205 [Prevotellaceae bacterium]|nr:hypothetical protein [Prevotellaceae bacterium]